MTRRLVAISIVLSILQSACNSQKAPAQPAAVVEAAAQLPKFVTDLPIPPTFAPEKVKTQGAVTYNYNVDTREVSQQILPPGYPPTTVWAYGGAVFDPNGQVQGNYYSAPGPIFDTKRNTAVNVTWTNSLTGRYFFAVDPTLPWARRDTVATPEPPVPPFPPGYPAAQRPVPTVPHVYGAQTAPGDNGGPLAWFAADGQHGEAYATRKSVARNAAAYAYPNAQPAGTLWYHDHALGVTRLNVLAGLAGMWIIRDDADSNRPFLPQGDYEIPLILQDRSFNADGSLALPLPAGGANPHPYWLPELFGETIVVNGVTWPRLDVEPRRYRFRVLNAASSRFFALQVTTESSTQTAVALQQIGSDAGYLAALVSRDSLLIAPGERADVVIDFAKFKQGTRLLLRNTAAAPYPHGAPPDAATVGQVMAFDVVAGLPNTVPLPTTLSAPQMLTADAPPRYLILHEAIDGTMTLNGQRWDAPATEQPRIGSTEDWLITNLTNGAQPLHLHLVQFRVVERHGVDAEKYAGDWQTRNGTPPLDVAQTVMPLDPSPYYTGASTPPDPWETGFKDTVVVQPSETLTLRVRFAPVDAPSSGRSAPSTGTNSFVFDPTAGQYVWHSPMLENQDNQMMRPLAIRP